MSYGYGGRANPFDQRGDAPQGGYNSQPPQYGGQQYGSQQYGNTPAMGRDEYTGNNVEMESLTANGGQFGGASQPYSSSNPILDECKRINTQIDKQKRNLTTLAGLYDKKLNDSNTVGPAAQIEVQTGNIMDTFRALVDDVRQLKSMPGANGHQQVGNMERKLRNTKDDYTKMENNYAKKSREQIARQYRIVQPDASEQEVRQVAEDPEVADQLFQQTMLQSNRRGQAQSTLSAVHSRHEEITKIVKQMEQLNVLFEEMANLVVQQEAAVTNIEMKGEEVVENMDKGNEQITTAIKSARNARKWKWWCLGISILIIIIIVIIILIVKFVINPTPAPAKTTTNKRSLFPTVNHRVIPGQPWSPTSERSVEVPVLKWTRDNNLAVLTQDRPVQPGVEWTPSNKKERRFQA